MDQNIEKSELAVLYTKITGLTADLDQMIDACETDAEKGELFDKILWTMKRGEVLENDGPYAAYVKKFLPLLIDELGVPTSGDIDMDGDSDENDAKLSVDIEHITNEIEGSTIYIETDSTEDDGNGVNID